MSGFGGHSVDDRCCAWSEDREWFVFKPNVLHRVALWGVTDNSVVWDATRSPVHVCVLSMAELRAQRKQEQNVPSRQVVEQFARRLFRKDPFWFAAGVGSRQATSPQASGHNNQRIVRLLVLPWATTLRYRLGLQPSSFQLDLGCSLAQSPSNEQTLTKTSTGSARRKFQAIHGLRAQMDHPECPRPMFFNGDALVVGSEKNQELGRFVLRIASEGIRARDIDVPAAHDLLGLASILGNEDVMSPQQCPELAVNVLCMRAGANLALRRSREAGSDADKATRLAPSRCFPRLRQAEASVQNENLDGAKQTLSSAVLLDDNSLGADEVRRAMHLLLAACDTPSTTPIQGPRGRMFADLPNILSPDNAEATRHLVRPRTTIVVLERPEGYLCALSQGKVVGVSPPMPPVVRSRFEQWVRSKAVQTPAGLTLYGTCVLETFTKEYTALDSLFYLEAVVRGDECLAWTDTRDIAGLLQVPTMPELRTSPFASAQNAVEWITNKLFAEPSLEFGHAKKHAVIVRASVPIPLHRMSTQIAFAGQAPLSLLANPRAAVRWANIQNDNTTAHLEQVVNRSNIKEPPGRLVLVGLPGAGKTTFAQQLVSAGGLEAANIDDRHNLTRADRAVALRRLEAQRDAGEPRPDVACVFFDVPAADCAQRADNRLGHREVPFGDGSARVKSMHGSLEPPTMDEGFKSVVTVREDGDVDRLLMCWGASPPLVGTPGLLHAPEWDVVTEPLLARLERIPPWALTIERRPTRGVVVGLSVDKDFNVLVQNITHYVDSIAFGEAFQSWLGEHSLALCALLAPTVEVAFGVWGPSNDSDVPEMRVLDICNKRTNMSVTVQERDARLGAVGLVPPERAAWDSVPTTLEDVAALGSVYVRVDNELSCAMRLIDSAAPVTMAFPLPPRNDRSCNESLGDSDSHNGAGEAENARTPHRPAALPVDLLREQRPMDDGVEIVPGHVYVFIGSSSSPSMPQGVRAINATALSSTVQHLRRVEDICDRIVGSPNASAMIVGRSVDDRLALACMILCDIYSMAVEDAFAYVTRCTQGSPVHPPSPLVFDAVQSLMACD